MLNIEVYVYNDNTSVYQRLDLYEDESVQFVDSIQDMREPDKIFTGYTKEFSVPASKNNNAIFKHFYEADISGGYDARVRADARMDINGFTYRSGQIKLNGAKLKDGKAFSYSLVFFGDTSKIKELLGDAKLKDLSELADWDHAYTFANIKSGFQTGLKLSGGSITAATNYNDAELVYPFITHTSAYEHDTGATPNFYDILATTQRLDHTELKPGIKWTTILDAIQGFTNDGTADQLVFDTSGFIADNDFKYMYLWLHNQKGGIVGLGENITYWTLPDFSYDSLDVRSDGDVTYGNAYFPVKARAATPFARGNTYDFNITFTITGSGLYDVAVSDLNGGGLVYQQKNINASSSPTTISFTITAGTPAENFRPQIWVKSAGGINAIVVEIEAIDQCTIGGPYTGIYDATSVNPNNDLSILSNMPDMKVMDFLSSAFNMFNLVVERQSDGTFAVETMDDYYAAGTTRDITAYVDPTETDVSPSAPYDKIIFKFEEAKSLLMDQRFKELGERYGDDQYDVSDVFQDNDYEIKIGFEKVLFERMINQTGGANVNILWSWCVDDKLDQYVGKPVVFYYGESLTMGSPNQVAWESDSSTSSTMAYCSNCLSSGTDATIGFKAEINEYTQSTDAESLFSRYWENYITGVYDITSRLIKVRAILPASFILSYSLADTIIYRNKEYFINEIDINIATGEADIELITKWL